MKRHLRQHAARSSNWVYPLVSRLDTADNLSEMQGMMLELRRVCRLSHATFLVMQGGVLVAANPYLQTTYPDEWTALYLRNRYFEIDPVIAASRSTCLPFNWSVRDESYARQTGFLDDSRSFRLGCSGISIPVRGPGGEQSLLSVTSQLDHPDWRRSRAFCQSDLLSFAYHLHERVMVLSGLRRHGRVPALSRRERECLELLARGKLIKQVAGILSISESAVKQYTRSSKRKLNAKTMPQATVRASQLGLIEI